MAAERENYLIRFFVRFGLRPRQNFVPADVRSIARPEKNQIEKTIKPSAVIPDEKGGYQPPTAQHASREGKVLARNIVARVRGKDLTPFRFKTLGLLASIGRRTGVARILGINFSGFVAWWLWRTIYLLKLPRFEKKLRVALDWTLDVFFSKDFVQYLHERAPVLADPSDVLPAGQPGPANQLAAVHNHLI